MKKNYLIMKLLYGVIPLAMICFDSCKKDFAEQNYQQNGEVRFPQTEQEKELVSLTSEIGNVLDTIYSHPEVVKEVNAAIYSGFNRDESIVLKELLKPKDGLLYQYPKFKERYFEPGQFYKYFNEEVIKNDYPLIIKYYGQYLQNPLAAKSSFFKSETTSASATPDTSQQKYEVWVVNNTKIYFPYSENFGPEYDPNKPINSPVYGTSSALVTTVTADRDADSGPGKEPRWVSNTVYPYVPTLQYFPVTVDDAYAETKATHIINVGDYVDPPPPPIPPPTTPGPIYTVYISWVRCNKQYDRLISFTKNGGGSELWFGEGYASRDASTGQINPNFPANPVYLSRKDIRKNRWVHPFVIWDTNWKTEQTNHALGIWEEDTQGSQTFTGSVSGAFKVGTSTITGTVGYSQTIVSNDPILRNTNLDRDYYFRTAAQDVESRGFQDGWPIRNADSHVDFTMPYQTF